MAELSDSLRTIDELKTFVHQKLCEKENLLADQFAMRQTQLIRDGRVCGLQFCLNGPRSVRLVAVWALDQNVVYFYDARGERYEKVQLSQRLSGDIAA